MGSELLLPASAAMQVAWMRIAPQVVQVGLVSEAATCPCPSCGRSSGRIHSHYTRTLQDVPAHGRVIQLCIALRRFFCDFAECPQRTFAEQAPELMALGARKTCRLGVALREIGMVAGGEAGARLARRLSMPVSPATLLRLIRRMPLPPVSAPRVLGVDDWAFRRGQRYGTILCDLETHQPVDLLPERSAEIFAEWLRTHPGAEIISRDRGGEYSKGASLGAPQAIQVADRWHLIHNLVHAFEQAMNRRHELLAEAAKIAARTMRPAGVETPTTPVQPQSAAAAMPVEPDREPTGKERRRAESQSRRQARFEQVKELETKGVSLRGIARQLNLNIHTVRRLAHLEQAPEHASRPAVPTPLDGFVDYLKERWEQGCQNASQLYREVKQRGFTGSSYMVQRRLTEWRNFSDAANATGRQPGSSYNRRPSGKQAAWMLLDTKTPPAQCSRERREFISQLHQKCPELADNVWVIHEFGKVLRERQPANLDAWMELVEEPTILPEVRSFAHHLRQDWAAVVEAVRQPWSNGQVEGQVNRLKLIKRLMYGRASFELLKARVLQMT
jgi:transposase